jgi:hypothetical protein
MLFPSGSIFPKHYTADYKLTRVKCGMVVSA